MSSKARPSAMAERRAHVDMVVGSHDDAASMDLRRRLAWCADEPRRSIEVDLTEMDERQAPTLFALLAATAHRARAVGSELRVVNVPEQLRPYLRTAGLRPAR